MQIHLSDITDSEGKIIQFSPEVELDKISFQMGEFPILDRSPVELRIANTGNKVLELTGKGSLTVGIPCDRCLEQVSVTAGCPCPVCGSTVHPDPAKLSDHAVTELEVEQAKKTRAAAEEKRDLAYAAFEAEKTEKQKLAQAVEKEEADFVLAQTIAKQQRKEAEQNYVSLQKIAEHTLLGASRQVFFNRAFPRHPHDYLVAGFEFRFLGHQISPPIRL